MKITASNLKPSRVTSQHESNTKPYSSYKAGEKEEVNFFVESFKKNAMKKGKSTGVHNQIITKEKAVQSRRPFTPIKQEAEFIT
jgi:hypothetical protein